jgi:hypothetical protein
LKASPFRLTFNLFDHLPGDIRGDDGKSQTGQPQGIDSTSTTDLKQTLAIRKDFSERSSEDLAHPNSNRITPYVLIIARCEKIVPALQVSIVLFTR